MALPTDTVAVAATLTPVPVMAQVIEASVNVRAGPGTTTSVIGKLKRDNVIELKGRNADGTWYQAAVPGLAVPGWVFAELLLVTGGSAESLPVLASVTTTPAKPMPATRSPTPTRTNTPIALRLYPTPTPRPTWTPWPTWTPYVAPTYPVYVPPPTSSGPGRT